VSTPLTKKEGWQRIASIENLLTKALLRVPHLNNLQRSKIMQYDADRAVAILAKALSVCRGILYSARTGDASQGEIERILESTGQESLIALMGKDTYSHVMRLNEALPLEDRDVLLSIRDEPY
jgi:hypothetical protein